ncbi:MAG: SH3 domain-containing protein [Thermomicrobiales bacterium]
MNARRFDALARGVSQGSPPANRRAFIRGLAAVALVGVMPRAAEAFDGGGLAPVTTAVGGVACISGVDCASGEICLNGACTPREPALVGQSGSGTATGTTGGGTAPTTPTETPSGVGGLIQPGAPLPARIYNGRCGQLGAEPAFQLIDVGSLEGVEEGETPQGALTAIPAEFSTTVVNTSLNDLIGADFAIDVRVDDADPATSIACGDIGGPIETGASGEQLAVGLQERGQSGYSGIAMLQQEGDRTLVQVFLARGLSGGESVTVAQSAPAEPTTEQAAAPEATVAAESAPAAATPTVGTAAPIGAGSQVVTTIDVNLRAEPADDAPVLTILGTGVELEVTGSPANGWVPVLEPASGQRGFVSDQFVSIVP